MALQATFRPLSQWPGERSKGRRAATFRASYADTLKLLEYELGRIHSRSVVIQAGFAVHDIRNDGWPRSNARKPVDPGVILSFQTADGPLSFPCDRFDDWEDNLRAIAKSLEALRQVERYGVTRNREQYRGWAQLPPPANCLPFATRQEAAIWLASVAVVPKDFILSDREMLESAYRSAAKKLHPDSGGSTVEFQRLQDAMRLLRSRDA